MVWWLQYPGQAGQLRGLARISPGLHCTAGQAATAEFVTLASDDGIRNDSFPTRKHTYYQSTLHTEPLPSHMASGLPTVQTVVALTRDYRSLRSTTSSHSCQVQNIICGSGSCSRQLQCLPIQALLLGALPPFPGSE